MSTKHEPVVAVLLLALCGIAPIFECCKDLLCNVDYIDTLTCKYGSVKGENANISYTLHAEWTFEETEETCDLIQSDRNQEYICTIDMEDFNVDDKCTIIITATVNGQYHSSQTCGPFSIGDKFKPAAPFNLTVSFSENYNISWETTYDTHVIRNGELAYELSYKKDGESWLNQKSIQVLEDEKNVILLRSSFQVNEEYAVRIRAQPKNTSIYSGYWSEWSATVTWRTPTDESIKNVLHNWILIPLLVFLLIVIILVFKLLKCLKWPYCLWKNVWVLVPDPEPFFQPLYVRHQGDFKSWLGSPYYPTMPFEGGIVLPEVIEIYSQSLLNNMEKQKLLLPKTCLSKKSQSCRKCGCINDFREKISKEIPIDTQCCSQCITTTTMDRLEAPIKERDSSGDGYPSVNLDSGNSNMLDHLMVHASNPDGTINSPPNLRFQPQENLLRPNMNILELLSMPPEEWELQDSPCQEDDENVFYNDENYNALSPDSGNSADFGYPRIGLDLDTIDSGFAESECGSPVDSDFGNSDIPPKSLSSDSYGGKEEISERNYVKQWVPSNPMGTSSSNKN